MTIYILTIFPEMVRTVLGYGVIGRAVEKGILEIKPVDLRDFATDKHRSVDDKPFGGGPGMVLRVDVVDRALQGLASLDDISSIHSARNPRSLRRRFQVGIEDRVLSSSSSMISEIPSSTRIRKRIVLLSPRGEIFNQRKAEEYSKLDNLILISGRYEGVDERVREHLADEELSIGEYVLSGGEIPAMAVADAVARLLPGVVGDPESLVSESFSKVTSNKLQVTSFDFPQYTQPAEYKGWRVPEVLRLGDHRKIREWREQRMARTVK